MAVGLKMPADIFAVPGVRLATASARIRYIDRDDLVLIELDANSTTAAVFTQNQFRAAPVVIAEKHLSESGSRYLLINAGNANAGTGSAGYQAALSSCAMVADYSKTPVESILPFSTGVIGELLDTDKIDGCVEELFENLSGSNWVPAAQAIMTTDTLPKACSRMVSINGNEITISGIAKGAGMIHPNMATMLAFVACDIAIGQQELDNMLRMISEDTFNSISVDGDTSTNDACVVMASGVSGVAFESLESTNKNKFVSALKRVMADLAEMIVRDGEGASKFVRIIVKDAESKGQAKSVAQTVATSPLVKTALAASDPNWGRILAAVGRAPVNGLDVNQMSLEINSVLIWSKGEIADTYSEDKGQSAMQSDEIEIIVSLGMGQESAHMLTTDLTAEYVRINAEYRT